MTESEYDRERAKLRETYGDNKQQAGIRWQQALALLFYRSGWTQEQLAKKEGVTGSYIDKMARYGRFLTFSEKHTVSNNLSETYFRAYWKRTDKNEKNERVRFREVQCLLEAEATFSRSHGALGHGKKVKAAFADGKWHKFETIVAKIGVPEPEVRAVVDLMQLRGTYGVTCERRKVGQHFEYRIFPKEKSISSIELVEKLAPIIKELKAQGRTNMATVSISTVATCAGRLQNLLDEWAE
jgi:hypothetical protein